MKKYLSIIVVILVILVIIVIFNLIVWLLPILLLSIIGFWIYFKFIKPQIIKFKFRHNKNSTYSEVDIEEKYTSSNEDDLYDDGPVIDVDYKDVDKKSKD